MSEPKLYRGHWPGRPKKTDKYSILKVGDEWKITALCNVGESRRVIYVEKGADDIVERVNAIKRATRSNKREGGVFYINEYKHLIVPIERNDKTPYFVDKKPVEVDFLFEFNGEYKTTKPINSDGKPLQPGDEWVGPTPAIPYVLAAGCEDIYCELPVLTDTNPPETVEGHTKRIYLSKVLADRSAVQRTVNLVKDVKKKSGGFRVNEYCAVFTPIEKKIIYCGQLDLSAWFPEPPLD